MRRKPNPDQRRRELCDAAIRLLADDGVKGLSHLKVDRKAGVPDGTTSFYFRTRSALLQAVAVRVSELDLKDLTAAIRSQSPPVTADEPSGLATLVMRTATGTRLVRTKARLELARQAVRDPLLDQALRGYSERFHALIRDAVLRLQSAKKKPDPAVADRQAYVVMTFISGLMHAFAGGDRRIRSAAELDAFISGIVAGIGSSTALR
ncbi:MULTISPECIES: TetR/AcrR family transcriptional regulator [Mycolicibacter]|uniref:TetR family transcriptional regulator C-terminal domain-containing protein n=1 Tax=[Mycobacterium] vasticus TaxID=2875777 RepID=A0ABU5YUM4_9MYCO|nr:MULTISPECIES: TetR family transcriptional regulator C-terminal domain-containing protein [unclassified Mycolicibacter]MEB3061891.1 TetR family transcriptional regulator C-terminal domain-containing protein [Mycolicibacter sp. MYC101]MEB3068129.1 TetR family transcriptional regulator C-terminal domain-containing protein [Mycolicibacter sp. MYC017]